VTIACDSSFFILKLNSALLSSAAEAGEDGIEVCFYTNVLIQFKFNCLFH